MVPAREPVTIKLYANRRLFEPALGRYVTFDELDALAHGGADVVVRDARTGADITDFILSRSPTEH
jgi:polyhydroxyalkanoate synthesis regulator protein